MRTPIKCSSITNSAMNKNLNYEVFVSIQLMALRLKLQACSLKKYRKLTQCIECYTFLTVE